MEKVLRYVVIAAALTLAGLLLSPVSRGYGALPRGFLSPVDGTNVSQLVLLLDSGKQWAEIYRQKSECASQRPRLCSHPIYSVLGLESLMLDVGTSFDRKSPAFKETRAELIERGTWFKDEGRLLVDKLFDAGKPLYEEHMNTQRKWLGFLTYVLNAIVAAISVLLIWQRKVIASKIANLFGAASTAAGQFHDKV